MFTKVALLVAAFAAVPALAYETVTCTVNATQNIITSIDPNVGFCTMLTGYGVYPVAPNEGCGSVYCYGGKTTPTLGPVMPAGYILSANYLVNTTYTQVTGCLNSAVWGQNPTDEGGQMDSHGWPYSCQGFKKFVSLIEPATNTYCLRCCDADNNIDCNTSISTKGCWNVVPGVYAMADGSACAPPVGAPAASATVSGVIASTVSGAAPTATAAANGTVVVPSTATGSAASSTGTAGATKGGVTVSAGSRTSFEALGAVAALALAVAASF